MAWLGISVDHGLFLHVFEPNIGCTYENAHKVTGKVILQSFEKPNGFIGYLVGHVSNVTLQMLDCPPNSPDLNHVENVWHQTNKIVPNKFKPHNHESLIEAIKKAFNTLKRSPLKQKVLNSINSVPKTQKNTTKRWRALWVLIYCPPSP